METLEDFYGRRLPKERVPDVFAQQAQVVPAFKKQGNSDICLRCGQKVDKATLLPTGNFYCRTCIVFGRLTSTSQLCHFPQIAFPKTQCLNWSGYC